MPVLYYKQAWQNTAGENEMAAVRRLPRQSNQDAFKYALSLVMEINKGTGKAPQKVIGEAEQMQQLLTQKLNKLKQLDDSTS